MSRRAKKKTLTKALATVLNKTLLPDLRERSQQPTVQRALRDQHAAEKEGGTTAATFSAWRDQRVEQVGAAWILACVFVRTLEDRDLLDRRRLAGPGAADSEQLFFELAPNLGYRDYLLTVFRELSRLPGADAVLGPGVNPLWRLAPSEAAIQALLAELREDDGERSPKWTFDGADTRFLGDLYQDLSESVRKRYALLQTPDFVESFILDRTLDPAVAEYGLDEVRIIDPTCGSGHFLLGAFARLFDARQRREPGGDTRQQALDALKQVYGVDLNPYAVAIARFRLTLAWLEAVGARRLSEAPKLPLNLAVADSLLHGAVAGGKSGGENLRLDVFGEGDEAWVRGSASLFLLDEYEQAERIFRQRYHVVVGNPPYITCKDAALREAYRERYTSAAGKYALSAPFCERFFQLATDAGFTGQITANSFMKREFGKKLVEEVLPHLDLTEVVDASGAYIPGHGTPTVLLFGRNRPPVGEAIPAVLGKRGEPTTPDDPATGRVWSAIAERAGEVGYEDEFLSIAELARAVLNSHPWSLGGGGAGALKELLENNGDSVLGSLATSVGISCVTGEDNVYLMARGMPQRLGIEHVRPLVIGEHVRDWSIASSFPCVFPYDSQLSLLPIEEVPATWRYQWPYRSVLDKRKRFGVPMLQRGLTWYELQELYADKLRTPLSITFAFVATHNHFVLDRGGKVFNRSAPIIKLPPDATEDDHLALLGYLNSSTACFWMKQVCSPKGMQNASKSNATSYLVRFEFDGTKLKRLPLPFSDPGTVGRLLGLAKAAERRLHERAAITFQDVVAGASTSAAISEGFQSAVRAREKALGYAIALQEEIDWLAYELCGFTADASVLEAGELEPVALGERPFEIALGHGDRTTEDFAWFSWHETTAAAEVPHRLPERQRASYIKRLRLVAEDGPLSLLESPLCKRRWVQPLGKAAKELQTDAKTLRDQADDWIEGRIAAAARTRLRQAAGSVTLREVADLLTQEPDFVAVCGWKGVDPAAAVAATVERTSVPHVAAARFTEPGLQKHLAWRETWARQRREDVGDWVGEIPVPPKYKPVDYRGQDFMRLRGKLDVPKERFISYPGAERDDDPSPLIGWAGWDHAQRAQALAGLYQDRKDVENWGAERLTPLLAGLLELVPWLKQWHNEPNADYDGTRLGDYFADFVNSEARELGLTEDDLRAWRPPKKTRGRKTKAKA